MKFSQNLSFYRELRGLSRKDFATMLDIPYTTYNNYEADNREPKFDLLIKMAEMLDISVDELLGVKKDDDLRLFNMTKKWIEKAGYKVGEPGTFLNKPETFIPISKPPDYSDFSYLLEITYLTNLVADIVEQSNQIRDTIVTDKLKFFFKNIPRGKEIISGNDPRNTDS